MSTTTTTTLVILATESRESLLETEIKSKYDSSTLRFRGVPKSLLPICGRPVLSYLYDGVKDKVKNVYIVTNAYNYKNYERWAGAHGLPRNNVLNCGFSTGPISDIAFVQRVKDDCRRDGMVIMARPDILYDQHQDAWFLDQVLSRNGNFVIYHPDNNLPLVYGIAGDVTEEKSDEDLASFVKQRLDCEQVTLERPLSTFGYLQDISFSEYMDKWSKLFSPYVTFEQRVTREPIHVKAYARVGLMGNPSDGFYGKTMSLLISNFWAEAILVPHDPAQETEFGSIVILPNPVADPHRFTTLESLASVCKTDGYENGDRLLLACCKVFYCYCEQNNIPIDTRRGFRVLFETNVPRQVGLAGSSAIITAFWKALLRFYNVTEEQIPLERQASLVLSVETDELGIAAGLQDRVIQAYGGLVYMDFDKEYMDKHGHGKYERLDPTLLPPLFLAYVANPEDSGKVHSTVKQRFLNGDPEVIEAMRGFASFTDRARECLHAKDHHGFAQLMTANFDLRRKVYGDAVVGATNIRMIELARQHNCVGKFPGSGGAVVGMWDGKDAATRETDLRSLRRALEKEGFVFVEITPKSL